MCAKNISSSLAFVYHPVYVVAQLFRQSKGIPTISLPPHPPDRLHVNIRLGQFFFELMLFK